jgi:hypothetical protein
MRRRRRRGRRRRRRSELRIVARGWRVCFGDAFLISMTKLTSFYLFNYLCTLDFLKNHYFY